MLALRKSCFSIPFPRYSTVRISTNPVTSNTSKITSLTFRITILPCLFMTFCAASRTRSPAEEIYSSFAKSNISSVLSAMLCFNSASSCGAVVVSSLPSKATYYIDLSLSYCVQILSCILRQKSAFYEMKGNSFACRLHCFQNKFDFQTDTC